MEYEKYRKRWNKCFIHDKILPEWVYRCINILMYLFDFWYYFLLLFARLQYPSRRKKYSFSICSIFKDESLSIKEWLEYHILIGVDHFYLYNNNTSDDSLDILEPYIKKGIVTLINWPYHPPCQVDAYNHFKDNYWEETQWVGFIDLDEFICLKRASKITEWLNKYKNYPSIVIYWKMFGSSGIIEHDKSKLIIEQYIIAWDKFDDIGKPIFNTRFKATETSLKYIHKLPAELNIMGFTFFIPPINEFKYFLNFRSNRVGFNKSTSDFTTQINHYVTKSYNEYFIKRRQRGDVNSFSNNTSIKSYQYTQLFAIKADYTIYRFLPFLKVRMSKNNTKNYFD